MHRPSTLTLPIGILVLTLTTSASAQDTPPQPSEVPAAAPAEEPQPAAPSGPSLEERMATLEGKVDGGHDAHTETRGIVDALSKIKLSGYIQGRFEYREDGKEGLSNTGSRGVYAPTETTQFLVRRGRLKATYAGTYAEFILQIDATPKGVVLKDAEATFIEPWSGENIRLTLGQFKWPFGYEVLQSSSAREMPERSLVIRRLFPGERDRGARAQWSHGPIRVAVAVVNGNGTEDSIYGANDQNTYKDLVGRVGVDLDWIVMGLSGYKGKGLFTKVGTPDAMTMPVAHTFAQFNKERFGFDVQTYLDVPHLGGLAWKGEIIWAQEVDSTGKGVEPLGWYGLAAQNFGGQLALFARLDQFDPDINKADNMITTIGGGVQFFPSGNARITLAYDHPMNQTTAASPAEKADDILTLQLQGMF